MTNWAERCQCGHLNGDHRSGGTRFPHPPQYGVCLVRDCGCTGFRRDVDDQAGERDRARVWLTDTGDAA